MRVGLRGGSQEDPGRPVSPARADLCQAAGLLAAVGSGDKDERAPPLDPRARGMLNLKAEQLLKHKRVEKLFSSSNVLPSQTGKTTMSRCRCHHGSHRPPPKGHC